MIFFTVRSLDAATIRLSRLLFQQGRITSPRGLKTKEIGPIGFTLSYPRRRYVSLPERRWNLRLAIGEFCWHVSGSNNVEFISHYAPRWKKFSEDGRSIAGSCYGWKIFQEDKASGRSEWSKLVELFRRDPSTRRAVLYLNKGDDTLSASAKDISCTSSVQFLIRHDRLDAITYMRSNDLIFGLPYDVFLFTMLQELLAVTLGVDLGTYHHIAASLHAYEDHFRLVKKLRNSRPQVRVDMPSLEKIEEIEEFLQNEERIRLSRKSRVLASPYWNDFSKVLSHPTSEAKKTSFDWPHFEKLLRLT